MAENLGTESLAPLPVLATKRGRDADNEAEPVGGVLEPGAGLSLSFDEAVVAFALAARKVLFTDTALNVAGFFAVELVRPWPLSPSLRDASVSEPPLTLTSAELDR
jgi:hypothetical protein